MKINIMHLTWVFVCFLPGLAFGMKGQSDSSLIFKEDFGMHDVSLLSFQTLPADISIQSHPGEEISLEVWLYSSEFDAGQLGVFASEIDLIWSVENEKLALQLLPDDAPSMWWRSTAPFFLDRRAVLRSVLRIPEWMNLELRHAAGIVSIGEHKGDLDLELESGIFKAHFLLGENNLRFSRSKAEISFFRKGSIAASQSEVKVINAPLLNIEATDFDIFIEQTGELINGDLRNGTLKIGSVGFASFTSRKTSVEIGLADRLEINSVNDSIFIANLGQRLVAKLHRTLFSVAGNYPLYEESNYSISASDSELLLFVDPDSGIEAEAVLLNSFVQWPDAPPFPRSGDLTEISKSIGNGKERWIVLRVSLEDCHFIFLR